MKFSKIFICFAVFCLLVATLVASQEETADGDEDDETSPNEDEGIVPDSEENGEEGEEGDNAPGDGADEEVPSEGPLGAEEAEEGGNPEEGGTNGEPDSGSDDSVTTTPSPPGAPLERGERNGTKTANPTIGGKSPSPNDMSTKKPAGPPNNWIVLVLRRPWNTIGGMRPYNYQYIPRPNYPYIYPYTNQYQPSYQQSYQPYQTNQHRPVYRNPLQNFFLSGFPNFG